MPRYILKSNGPGTDAWTIRHARRNVGFVRRNPDLPGVQYVGKIGEHRVVALSAEMAFREVAARAMGFENAAALRAHNAQVRRSNNAQRSSIRSRLRTLEGRSQRLAAGWPDEPETFETIPDNL